MSQRESGSSTKLVVADNVWVYVAVSLPLTICTVGVWWVWVQFQGGLIRLPRPGKIAGMFARRGRQRFKNESVV